MARNVPKHLLGIIGRLAKEIDSQGTNPLSFPPTIHYASLKRHSFMGKSADGEKQHTISTVALIILRIYYLHIYDISYAYS